MSEAKTSAASAPQSVSRKSRPGWSGKRLPTVSRDAQRMAAAILEVLAGVRTPTEAATALSLSVPRYYLWEQRALEGLVRACEPRPVGKAAHERHRMAVLEKEVARLRQDCTDSRRWYGPRNGRWDWPRRRNQLKSPQPRPVASQPPKRVTPLPARRNPSGSGGPSRGP